MNILELSYKLLKQYGYTNWTVEFDASNAFADKTVYATNTLVFAECLQSMSEHVVRDVIIHEIAHVRAGQFVESHGKYWRSLAVSMGGTGNRRVANAIRRIIRIFFKKYFV